MTPSKALFCFCIALSLGVGLQSIVKIPLIILWGFLIAGISLVVFSIFSPHYTFRGLPWYGIGGFCILFLALGVLRLQITEFSIENDPFKKLHDSGKKVFLIGRVAAEPDIRDSLQRLRIDVNGSAILVATVPYPEYQYLDKVNVTGQLKSPPRLQNFNYKNYLLKEGIYSVMDFPTVELLPEKHEYNIFSYAYENILFLKSKLIFSVSSNFSPPQNFVINGVVFGKDNDWPRDLKEKFTYSGLSHITAVSGSNIVILIKILAILLLSIGLWRQQALWASVALVWLYIALVGFPASAVRAGIMGSILLLAEIFGRQNTSSRSIMLAGAFMILHNPFLLFYDVGFQLSFLASMGIIHVKPLIDSFLGFRQESKSKSQFKVIFKKVFVFLLDIVSITLSAQVLVLPILIYNFGKVSLISPMTNLLVLPIVPFLMVFGFISGILGIFSGFLGWVFALPCYTLIFYLLKVLDIFYQPWAVVHLKNISWILLLAYYPILGIGIFYLNRKLKPKFLGY